MSQGWTALAEVIMMVVRKKTDFMSDGNCHPMEYRRCTEQKMHGCVHGWWKAKEISTWISDAAALQKT